MTGAPSGSSTASDERTAHEVAQVLGAAIGQPDLQWVRHPAGIAGARDALVVGLRLVFVAGYPEEAPSPSSADPTVSPEGPQPVTREGATPHTRPE